MGTRRGKGARATFVPITGPDWHLIFLSCFVKLPFLLLALLASGLLAQAQPARPVLRVATSAFFYQMVGVQPHKDQPYRLSMRARADTTAGSWASLGVMFLSKKHFVGVGDLHSQKPPQRVYAPQWQTYTITGTLPAKADTLRLLPNVHDNGVFAFDDFRLEVRQPSGVWQEVPLKNGSFETPAPADSSATRLPPGWRAAGGVAGYTYRQATEAGGNHYLQVRGTGIVNYGHNRAAGHYQVANGVKLYYETYGQGPPLLLLHGNGESIYSFSNQIAALAAHYRVIAVDTRDHGQSARTKGRLTYDLLADDMRALLDSLHVPAAHVVGWSDGGNTGLSLALRYPGRVRALVTMGANLYADTTAVDAKMLKEVRQMYRLTTVVGPFKQEFHRAHRLTAMLLHYPQMRPAQLGAIRAPTLVIAGEKDIIKRPHTELIAKSIPGAQLAILPGLTHYAPQENPVLFNQTLLDFLAQH